MTLNFIATASHDHRVSTDLRRAFTRLELLVVLGVIGTRAALLLPAKSRAKAIEPMNIISTKTAQHYPWGEQCDGWHLIRSEVLSVIQERMPPATSEVRHYHAKARQFFFVLSGQLSIVLQGEIHRLGVEEGLEIAPGMPHRVFNDSAAEARFLVVSSPPAQGDRVACREEADNS